MGRQTIEKKQANCKHDFVFDVRTRNLVFPHYVHGCCRKCGKSVSIPNEEYEKKYLEGD